MKKTVFTILILAAALGVDGQSVTLDDCMLRAAENYPIHRNESFIEQSLNYNVENAKKGLLPQITISGKATWQSDVTKIPVSLPGFDIPQLSKDQYSIAAEVSQTIYDGNSVAVKKLSAQYASQADLKRHESDLYTVKNRVSEVYFAILTIDAQIEQNLNFERDIDNAYKKISALKNSGMANGADINRVELRKIRAHQQTARLKNLRSAYLEILSAFTGDDYDEDIELKMPENLIEEDMTVTRPELQLFDAQKELLLVREKEIKMQYAPKISAFVQGGYANPALNMFEYGFQPYCIAGVRFNWNVSAFYRKKNDRAIIKIQADQMDVQRDVFIFNTDIQSRLQNAEIQNIQRQLEDDDKEIEIQGNIRHSTEIRLENGTASVSDYLDEISAENIARQNQKIHNIELLKTIYQLKNTLGKL